jgi:hypothetical protein
MNEREIVIYRTPDATTNLEARLEEDAVWLGTGANGMFLRERTVINKNN